MSLVDPRITKQAEILVDYSLKVKKGENIIIVAEMVAKPLVIEIYKHLLKRGAMEVRFRFDSERFSDEISENYYKLASNEQLDNFPKIEMYEMQNVDCYIRIDAKTNTRGLSGIDSEKFAKRAKVIKPILDHRVGKTRWVVTKYPTEGQAQEADMSLAEYSDFVLNAITEVNWPEKFKEQERLRKRVDATSEVRIVGLGTDLKLNIKGRKAENGAGDSNMPDGEVFTSVQENGASGYITYTYPALYQGKEFHEVRLEFKDGKVIKATAEKGQNDLNKILDTDRGARIIGELGIGNNFAIRKFTKDILFDEKIGGSIHLALGSGYKKTGSKNESAIHWDMIKDLRQGGELWFDEELVQRKGKWLIKS